MKVMITASLALALVSPAAANILVNGDFETGNYVGWTTSFEGGSSGNVQIEAYDGFSPISNLGYAANAPGGSNFSITDQNGPGAYSLTQSFTLGATTLVNISFDMFANNWSGVNINNGRLSSAGPNQNAVVDILGGTAGAFTTNPLDIVATLYGPGSDAIFGTNPWTSYSSSMTLAAGTYQIRFAQADNQLFFQQGVDNVSISAAVPEPASWALLISGFGLVGAVARRRRRLLA